MLQFKKLEVHKDDTVIFPAIDLLVKPKSIVAIHSHVTIREQLIKMLTFTTIDYVGEIIVNDHPLTRKTKDMLQLFRLKEHFYDRLTVKETIQFMIDMTSKQITAEHLIKKVRLEINMNTRISQLTFSEQKRLQLAIVLLFDSPVLIFEEPDQNIDIESRKIFVQVMNELKDQGKTLCILTANMESALRFSDEVYRLTDKGLHKVMTEEDDERRENTSTLSANSQPIRLEKIPSKVEDKIVLFDPLEIDHIESYEGVAYLYIDGDDFPTTKTLQKLEEKLNPFGFFRCHRSYIINLQKVREVITWTRNSYSLTLDDQDKTTIPLSKAKLSTLKEMLGL